MGCPSHCFLPIDHWHAWIGDATIADAMLHRLMQRHHRFTLTGHSLRIKAHNLQNPANKRNILCDAKLKAVLGKDEMTMFELTGLAGKHLS
jgi:hypothetical protein